MSAIPLLVNPPQPRWFVRQRDNWDCAIACVAMALRVSYEQAEDLLGPRGHDTGYYPHQVALAVGGEIDRYDWAGSLERCIVQVVITPNGPPKHFVYIHKGIHCPESYCDRWSKIHGIGVVIRVPRRKEAAGE